MTPSHVRKLDVDGGAVEAPVSLWPTPSPQPFGSDEIDLVELGASLWQRWKLMLATFLVCIGAGLAVALLLPRSYGYTLLVRLGSYTRQDGSTVPVLTPNSAVATLNGGMIDTALLKYAASHDINARTIKVKASTGESAGARGHSDTVSLYGKGRTRDAATYKAVERAAAASLAASTAAQINVVRADIKQKLVQAQLKLEQIEDADYVKAQKAGLQQRLASVRASLAGLVQQVAVLRQKRAHLKAAETLYGHQEKELSAYIARVRESGLSANHTGNPTQAMSVLLLNNQIQQNQRQLNQVERNLTVTLPQEIAAVDAKIADDRQQESVKRTAVEEAAAKLGNFDASHRRAIEAQKNNIDEIKTRLANVQATRVIVGPEASIRPVGLPRSVIAVLGGVLGVILALLVAALANYIAAVRRHLVAQRMAPAH